VLSDDASVQNMTRFGPVFENMGQQGGYDAQGGFGGFQGGADF